MDNNTCKLLLKAHAERQTWNTQLKIVHRNEIIDVSCPSEEIPTPIGTMPPDCYYQFDPEVFRGTESKDDLITLFREACTGCTLHSMQSWTSNSYGGCLHLKLYDAVVIGL